MSNVHINKQRIYKCLPRYKEKGILYRKVGRIMATKKKGILTTSPEWARHLRPIMKRWFWKGERNAESVHIKAETGSKFIHSVEELLLEVESWDTQADEKRLHVAIPIMLKGNVVQPTIGMSIVLDKVLGKGYSPNKAIEQQSGTIYFYTR